MSHCHICGGGYPPRKAGRVSESHYLFRRMRAGEPAAESGFAKTAAGETDGLHWPPPWVPRHDSDEFAFRVAHEVPELAALVVQPDHAGPVQMVQRR